MNDDGKSLTYYFRGTLFGFRSLLIILIVDLIPFTSNNNTAAALATAIAVSIFEYVRFPTPWYDKLIPMLIKGFIAGLIVFPDTGVLGALSVVASLGFLQLTKRPKEVSLF